MFFTGCQLNEKIKETEVGRGMRSRKKCDKCKKLLNEKPDWEGYVGDVSTNGKVLLKYIMER